MWLFSRWKLNIPSLRPLRRNKPASEQQSMGVWEKKSKMFTEIRARSHYRRTIRVRRDERARCKCKTGERIDQVDWASLTKPTCPLTKGDMKNRPHDGTALHTWLTARTNSIREYLRTSRSLCLPLSLAESGPNSRMSRARVAKARTRARLTSGLALSRRSLAHDSFDSGYSIYGWLSYSERKGLPSKIKGCKRTVNSGTAWIPLTISLVLSLFHSLG